MKKDKLQQTMQKCKGQSGRNGEILRKVQPSKTEPGRNRKYK